MAKRRTGSRRARSGRKTVGSAGQAGYLNRQDLKPQDVLVRGVPTSALDNLDRKADDRGISRGELLRLLLEKAGEAGSPLVHEIVDQKFNSRLHALGSALESLWWADRAFALSNWAWAINGYAALLNRPPDRQFAGLTQWSWYRSGFAFAMLARKYEQAGIDQRSSEAFRAAETALCHGIACQHEFYRAGGTARIVEYNDICALALRARVAIHRALVMADSPLIEKLKGVRDAKFDRTCISAWQGNAGIGMKWRSVYSASPELIRDVERFGSGAMKRLETLTSRETEHDSKSPSDVDFWVEYAQNDADLCVLRFDKNLSNAFNRWFGDWTRKLKTDNPHLDALANCAALLPERILQESKAIQRKSDRPVPKTRS